MKKTAIGGLALAMFAGSAHANFCARDAVPAATLLVPYALVGLDASNVPDPNAYTTILDVINLSNEKQIIHVVVWDALGNPVVDFDEVLSGYDVWQINFRDLLTGSFNLFDTGGYDGLDNGNGPKPQSKPPYPEIGDFWKGTLGTLTSPWAEGGITGFPYQYGPSSNSILTPMSFPPGYGAPNLLAPQDIDYPVPASTGCHFPYGPAPGFGPTIVSLLQAAITPGLPQDASDCVIATVPSPDWLVATADNPVFFWVTVDAVTACTEFRPNEVGYWTGGVPSTNNVLAGTVYYLAPAGNFSDSVPAVAIEADLDWASPTPHAGFYSQLTENFVPPVHDFHEPLPTAYAFEYYNGGGITSNLMVWKNTTELERNRDLNPVGWEACRPYIYYAWDQNENSKQGGCCWPYGRAYPNEIPYQTQKVPLTPANFWGMPASAGWMLLVFDPSILGATYYSEHGPLGNLARDAQAWVGVQYYWGTYSTEVEAITLGNFWCFPGDVMPKLNTYHGVLDGVLKR